MQSTITTQVELESVIVKVRKLLRLADENKNSSEYERNAAMEAAMSLMQEYNLSHTAMTTKLHDEAAVSNVTKEKSSFRNERWISCLASAVSQLYYTAIYTTWEKGKNVIAFVGTPTNIAASISLTEWLLESIRKESNRQFADPHTRKSFRLGAVRRLQERAAEFLREEKLRHDDHKYSQEREYTSKFDHSGNCLGSEDDGFDNEGQPVEVPQAPQNQLMVLRTKLQDDNDAFLDTLGLSKGKGRASRTISVSGNAYNSGKSYASGISLNKQIGGTNPKRIGG